MHKNVISMHNNFLFLNYKEQGYIICRKWMAIRFHIDEQNYIYKDDVKVDINLSRKEKYQKGN